MLDCPFKKNSYSKTYGELTKKGLTQILKGVKTKNKTFVDIGSGKGSVVINVVNNYPQIKKVIGIELDKERHEEAEKRIKKEVSKKNQKKITLINGDMLTNYSYSDCDLIYISNLCFSNDVNMKLSKKLNKELCPGSKVFTSRHINKLKFSKKNELYAKQSWNDRSNINKYTIKNNKKSIYYK